MGGFTFLDEFIPVKFKREILDERLEAFDEGIDLIDEVLDLVKVDVGVIVGVILYGGVLDV